MHTACCCDSLQAMDELDRAILAELADDARIPMTRLAERVHLSRAHLYRRVDALHESGVIRGFSVDVDPQAAGLDAAALVLLQTDQARWADVQQALRAMPQVQFAAATTGEVDVAALVRASSVEELRDVVLSRLASLDVVERVTTLVVLDELVPPRPVLP